MCPIDFRVSGHFILSLLSFLYQLLDVTAFKNLIPAKYKSKLKILSNLNYKLPKPEW